MGQSNNKSKQHAKQNRQVKREVEINKLPVSFFATYNHSPNFCFFFGWKKSSLLGLFAVLFFVFLVLSSADGTNVPLSGLGGGDGDHVDLKILLFEVLSLPLLPAPFSAESALAALPKKLEIGFCFSLSNFTLT